MIQIFILLLLSFIDIVLTFNYVYEYKKWQPNKPYHLIELNPLLVLLWKYLGLRVGTIIGAVLIFSLVYLIGATAHIGFSIVLGIFLSIAIFNHFKNFKLLNKLIAKYPNGKLPEKIFGKVEGNNK